MAERKKAATARKPISKKKVVTWILVADGARARILVNHGPGKGIGDAFPCDFIGPHEATREMVSDKPGREQESWSPPALGRASRDGLRHSMEPRTDYHRFEKAQFARRMAEILEKAAMDKSYDRLVLVAPPQALGDLRALLGRHARERLLGEVDKDLTHVAIDELPKYLSDVIALGPKPRIMRPGPGTPIR